MAKKKKKEIDNKTLPSRKDLTKSEEECASSEQNETHVEDVIDVDGEADLAGLGLFRLILLVGLLRRCRLKFLNEIV